MRSSFSYSSRCDRIEIHSPDAIENAPATSPATPGEDHDAVLAGAAGDAHHQREVRHQAVVHAEHDRPQRAADAGTVATFRTRRCGRPAGMPCIAAMVRPAAASCCAMARGGLGVVAVAVGLGRLGAQHQRQHGLGAEASGEEAQRLHAERHPRPSSARRRPCAAGAPSARRGAPRRRRAAGTRRDAGRRRSRRARGTACRPRARRRTSPGCRSRRFASDLCRAPPRHGTQLVADFPEAQAASAGASRPAAARSRARRMRQDVTRADLADADVDERADDRPHHLPAERGGADLVAQHAVAHVAPLATSSTRRIVVEPAGPLRQKLAKSCSPRNGSAPSRMHRQVERRRAPTTRTERGTGRARRGSRSCTGTSRHCAECRASKSPSTSSALRTTTSGPSWPLIARCRTARIGRRRRPRSSRPVPTRARRRRCAPRTSAGPACAARARAPRAARLRPCAGRVARRTRGSRCPSYATTSFE